MCAEEVPNENHHPNCYFLNRISALLGYHLTQRFGRSHLSSSFALCTLTGLDKVKKREVFRLQTIRDLLAAKAGRLTHV